MQDQEITQEDLLQWLGTLILNDPQFHRIAGSLVVLYFLWRFHAFQRGVLDVLTTVFPFLKKKDEDKEEQSDIDKQLAILLGTLQYPSQNYRESQLLSRLEERLTRIEKYMRSDYGKEHAEERLWGSGGEYLAPTERPDEPRPSTDDSNWIIPS